MTGAPTSSAAPVAPGAAPINSGKHAKNYVKTMIFTTMFGYFGVDRFYLGKIGTGILKLLTLGGFGLWVLIDFIITLVGGAREKGRPELELEDTEKYKPFFVKLTLVLVAIYAFFMIIYIAFLFVILPLIFDAMQSSLQEYTKIEQSEESPASKEPALILQEN